MKLIPLTFLTLFFIPSTGYKTLSWDDFKGRPTQEELNQGWVANTETYWTLITNESEDLKRVYFLLEYGIDSSKSWTITNSNECLRHEQVHASISAILAAKCKKALQPYQGIKNTSENKAKADSIYEYWWQKEIEMQRKFDLDTNHSKKKEVEKQWEKRILVQAKSS